MGLGFRVHDECRGVYLHSRANLNFCLEVISVSALAFQSTSLTLPAVWGKSVKAGSVLGGSWVVISMVISP